MITHLQTNTWIKLLFIICLYLTISCNSNRKNTEKQTGIPSPKNLTAYFDSLQHHGFYIPYHSDSTDREKVMHTIDFYKNTKQESVNSTRRKKCKPHLNSCVTNWDI